MKKSKELKEVDKIIEKLEKIKEVWKRVKILYGGEHERIR